MGGGCRCGFLSVFSGEDLGEAFEGELAAGNVEQGSGNVSDHFIEKSVGFEFKDDFVWVLEDVEAHEVADGVDCGTSAVGFIGEGGEVMLADEVMGRFFEEVDV